MLFAVTRVFFGVIEKRLMTEDRHDDDDDDAEEEEEERAVKVRQGEEGHGLQCFDFMFCCY